MIVYLVELVERKEHVTTARTRRYVLSGNVEGAFYNVRDAAAYATPYRRNLSYPDIHDVRITRTYVR